MTGPALSLYLGFLLLVLGAVKPLGLYMAHVFEGRPIWPLRLAGPLERAIYRMGGVEPAREMGWKEYTIGLLLFNALGALAVYLLQRCQLWLPLNPQKFSNLSPDSAFNTAVSFVTNTNWQGYSGESAMSYLTQMAALAVQNFLSAVRALWRARPRMSAMATTMPLAARVPGARLPGAPPRVDRDTAA
ncbi:MAG: potassium-transporting ATPase subunit KdpA [Gammaproteobacteria bacterium]|nr:potassium-transporting ATPase subunit KdpA [Gammaproteobacteria bacterium]